MSTADLLAQGIAAARAGHKAEAQATLLKVLEADDRSEVAWLWLSGVMESSDERRICLENVLTINPANTHARRGIELLGPRQPTPAPDAPAAAPQTPPQADATLRLPDADGNMPAAPAAAPVAQPPAASAGPTTGDTVELPAVAVPAPAKQPWWRRQKPKAAEPPHGQPAAAPPPPALAPAIAMGIEPAKASLTLPTVAAEAGNTEEPCPYCGATTHIGHRSCPACHKSLMVRGKPRDQRSVALIILVVIYGLNSLGALVGGVLLIMTVVGMASTMTSMGMDFPILPVVAVVVAVLIAVGILISVTLGLFRRKPGAYIVHCINVGLSTLSTIGMIVMSTAAGAALLTAMRELEPARANEAAGAVGAAAGSLGMAVVCNVIMLVGFIALTVLSHSDFYGRKARMSTAGLTSDGDAYNAGISYRNRGMWYMAAHQWELAAMGAPRDVMVRRALGLAYAQLKRYDQARDALSVALAMAPGDHQLIGDLELVERLAKKR